MYMHSIYSINLNKVKSASLTNMIVLIELFFNRHTGKIDRVNKIFAYLKCLVVYIELWHDCVKL